MFCDKVIFSCKSFTVDSSLSGLGVAWAKNYIDTVSMFVDMETQSCM